MCRLTAAAGAPIPLSTLVFGGAHSLLRQSWAPRELRHGSVNADGWGVVWWDEGAGPADAPRRHARAEPAWYDPDLERALAGTAAPVAAAALRNATPGLPVDRSALLPIVVGPWAFVLNGFVPGFRARHMRALREPLPDDLYAELRGVSDAETLALRAVASIREGATPFDALDDVAAAVAARLEASEAAPLTMVLAGPDGVWAVNTSAGPTACNSLYVVEGHRLAPRSAVLASEALDDSPDWRAVPPHGRVRLRRDGTATVKEGAAR